MTYLIVGGSSGLGRSIAEVFASKGENILLIARNEEDLSAVAHDLQIQFNVVVNVIVMDLSKASFSWSKLDLYLNDLKGILLPIGYSDSSDLVGANESLVDRIYTVNFTSICKLIYYILNNRNSDESFLISGFGSIAAGRGRGKNIIYSAAKSALQMFFGSLRHACVGTNIMIQFYIIGYMDTNLAFVENVKLPKTSPNEIATLVYKNKDENCGVVFCPWYWKWIILILKCVPWSIYKKLNF